MSKNKNFLQIIDYLEETLKNRKNTKKKSYSKSLLDSNVAKVSQKVGEEAIELVIASNYKDKEQIIYESADLIFHLLVLWNITGIKLDDLAKELEGRKNDR